MTSLAALLESSSRLSKTQQGPSSARTEVELPAIQLGFDQLVTQSRRILDRTARHADSDAYFLLASAGVNPQQQERNLININLANTFEPLLPISDTDVEGYLQHTHEQTIIASIEEGRRATVQSFYTKLDNGLKQDWEKVKEKLFDELGRHSASTPHESTPRRGASTASPRAAKLAKLSPSYANNGIGSSATAGMGSLQMHSKMMKYDLVIKRLNRYRKEGHAFGLVGALSEAAVGEGVDAKSLQIQETYTLLASLVGENNVIAGEFQRNELREGEFLAAYTSPSGESRRELMTKLKEGSKKFLEGQFMNYVEKTVANKPTEAQLGGIPTVDNKIRAFLNVKYYKNGSWNGGVEIANSQPVWAKIYYLLRSGHMAEALQYVIDNSGAVEILEKNFITFFSAWVREGRRLPKSLRSQFLTEFNTKLRYQLKESTDPYKYALYKLIGRLELFRKNVAGVTGTTEDWIWFQLALVEETTTGGGGATGGYQEKFDLEDLGKCLVGFGEKHFDPKGNKPLLYFQVLTLCGQLERAVAYLYQFSQYQIEAVHFAIVLRYYGLLRIPKAVSASEGNILIVDPTTALPSLNFSRLLHRYTRAFVLTDPTEALNYIYLICLNATTPTSESTTSGRAGKGKEGSSTEGMENQVGICHDYIREVVMDTRRYTDLLGDVRNDGTKIPGMLEQDLRLINIKDEKTYLNSIVKEAALRADQEKRFSDSILLYNLAEEYDAVVLVLVGELGRSLAKPSSTNSAPTSGNADDSMMTEVGEGSIGASVGREDIISVTKSILNHYDRMASIGSKVSRKNRESCEILLRLKEGITLYQEGKLEMALMAIEAISLLPLHSDLVLIIRASEEFKELDEAIIRNFDIILLTTMNIIYKLHQGLKESVFGDASRQQKMTELRQKARSLMMFAGMLRYRLTSETYASLTRLDVFIH